MLPARVQRRAGRGGCEAGHGRARAGRARSPRAIPGQRPLPRGSGPRGSRARSARGTCRAAVRFRREARGRVVGRAASRCSGIGELGARAARAPCAWPRRPSPCLRPEGPRHATRGRASRAPRGSPLSAPAPGTWPGRRRGRRPSYPAHRGRRGAPSDHAARPGSRRPPRPLRDGPSRTGRAVARPTARRSPPRRRACACDGGSAPAAGSPSCHPLCRNLTRLTPDTRNARRACRQYTFSDFIQTALGT